MNDRCKGCLNSRCVVSENGYHYICCLPYLKMVDCIKGFTDYYTGIKNISTNRE